jgi:hypothetical protein
MLSHLRHVSILTQRDVNQEIGTLIRTIRPDTLITSESTKDFPISEVEAYREYCGDIVTLPPQATTSTTARIRTLTIDGADMLARSLEKRIPEVVREALNEMRGI